MTDMAHRLDHRLKHVPISISPHNELDPSPRLQAWLWRCILMLQCFRTTMAKIMHLVGSSASCFTSLHNMLMYAHGVNQVGEGLSDRRRGGST